MISKKCLLMLPFLLLLVSPAIAEDEDLNTQLMRATVKISHDKSTATGFVLSNEKGYILVTAAHVFDNTPGDETTIVFRSQQAEGEYTKEPTKLVIRKEGKPIWQKHPTEDVAAIGITPPQNADIPQLSTELLTTDEQLRTHKVHPGEKVVSIGFPHRVEGSKAGFPLLRDGTIASFPLLPTIKTKTFYLSANTFEGDSGGPVYLSRPNRLEPDKEETRLIVGLVSAQQFLDEEAKMIYGTSKIRHRLGFAVVVHASLIRETIDLLK
ncbi:MAG: serine protease [Planctomycetia bacterium]|nr:serine protease [Planctomycetia bacterium]